MKKALMVVLSVFIFYGTAEAQQVNTEAEANAVYAPQIESESYSVNFPYHPGLPFTSHVHGSDGKEERRIVSLPWKSISVETLKPGWSFWGLFSKPYKTSVWFEEEPNDEPIEVVTEVTEDMFLLGEVQLVNTGDMTPLEAVRRALYGAKKEMGTKKVVISVRDFPVRNASSKGFGGSSGGSFIGDNYKDAATVGGSGILSYSTGWSEVGNDVIISCYTTKPGTSARRPAKQSTEKRAVDGCTDSSVIRLKQMLQQ